MAKPPSSLKIIDGGSVGANDTGVTSPLYVGNYWKKTINIKTTKNCNVYAHSSPDGTEVMHIKSGYSTSEGGSTDDGDYVHVCNNASIAFDVDVHCNYLILVVDNQEASACTVDAWLTGVGQ